MNKTITLKNELILKIIRQEVNFYEPVKIEHTHKNYIVTLPQTNSQDKCVLSDSVLDKPDLAKEILKNFIDEHR